MGEDKQHTTEIDWQTLIESALILALVGMVMWIVEGAR